MLYIVGRTASGKDYIANKLIELGYKQVVSKTTRERRMNEGDTHLFVNSAEFVRDMDNNRIFTWTSINGNKYWATKEGIRGKDFYIIDFNGLLNVKELSNGKDIVILIGANDEQRKAKFIERGGDSIKFNERDIAEHEQFVAGVPLLEKRGFTNVTFVNNTYTEESANKIVDYIVECLSKGR